MTDGVVRADKRPARSHAAVKRNFGINGRNHQGRKKDEDDNKKTNQNTQHWMELLDGPDIMMFNHNG